MATVDARLAALRLFLESHASGETVFIVEGGAEYHTYSSPWKSAAFPPAACTPETSGNRYLR